MAEVDIEAASVADGTTAWAHSGRGLEVGAFTATPDGGTAAHWATAAARIPDYADILLASWS
ncbi:hypothetical protein GCM10009665_10460 [Kitasatospora nipponensis]|uniref:Uncharacterized protein n=1 Tax=Kitasatospora nipponensis TaxID=258049 RepID=A0ABN1VTL3_9ACTN